MAKELPNIFLQDFDSDNVERGVRVAKQFLKDYPDSFGFKNFAIYGHGFKEAWVAEMMAYRTKTRVVVRWIAGKQG